ncbi:hypothetical protein BASA82_000783 [Batrachochytrium salamandrivorans]|nr:hypothetical protein BASA62_001805 [Batrachochytrium salamandrivorans]KAH9262160.1 hypothetical protein BASA82_000783 [Batrachochytrium salamandrivorans]KAH9276742.1 hypothetical protein BASA83_000877 [Batrachochytrium salamandrivorans]KAJ1332880.1 hypothetical protein BSLG_008507 [Batrachochytrium salamandrivorans]
MAQQPHHQLQQATLSQLKENDHSHSHDQLLVQLPEHAHVADLPRPTQLQSPLSVRPEIDFDSMLQDLVATESLVSMKLMSKDSITIGRAQTGTVRDLVVSPAHSIADLRGVVPTRLQTLDTPKSVLFVDEASPTEFASRLAASHSNVHIPFSTLSAVAAASTATADISSGISLSDSGHNLSTLSLEALTPTMARAISFDEDAPPISISNANLFVSNGLSMSSSAGSAEAVKRSNSAISSIRLSLGQSMNRKSSILKESTSTAEPDTLPLVPDLDAEDNYDSDDYRELYGADYDRYNLFSSDDEYDSGNDRSESDSDSHIDSLSSSGNSRSNSDTSLTRHDSIIGEAAENADNVSHTTRSMAAVRLNSNISEMDEDIDLPDDDDQALLRKPSDAAIPYTYQGDAISNARSTFQSATVDDYEDMDGLLNVLDKIIRRNRSSKPSLNLDDTLQSGLQSFDRSKALSPTPVIPGFVLPEGSDDDDDDTDHSHQGKSAAESRIAQVIHNEQVAQYMDAQESKQDKISLIMAKLNEANVKKITTRIYIEDARSFKTLVLTSLMSADQVVRNVIDSFHLDASPDWALFELCNDIGVERPIRDWEIVTDIISAWDSANSVNAIVMKKYGYRVTLSCKSLTGRFPRVQGYLYLELKPGKWQKRFCVLRDSIIYYYQEADKLSTETMLCNLLQFDVYTLSQHKKRTPTEFYFALRSTGSPSVYESKEDYCKIVSVEKRERLYDWVLALRLARNERMFIDYPETFEDYENEISSKALRRRAAVTPVSKNRTMTAGQLPDRSVLRALSSARTGMQHKHSLEGENPGLSWTNTPQAHSSTPNSISPPHMSSPTLGPQPSVSDSSCRRRNASLSNASGMPLVASDETKRSQRRISSTDEVAYRREKDKRRSERRDREAYDAWRAAHPGSGAISPPLVSGTLGQPRQGHDRQDPQVSLPESRSREAGSSSSSRNRSSGSSRKGKIKPLVDISGL